MSQMLSGLGYAQGTRLTEDLDLFLRLRALANPTRESLCGELVRFNPEHALERYSQSFPEVLRLFETVGIHPRFPHTRVNPYTKEVDQRDYRNIGEHCLAVGFFAETLGNALQAKGFLSVNQVAALTKEALLHDVAKPHEIMRKSYLRSLGDQSSRWATPTQYEALAPFLEAVGLPASDADTIAKAGAWVGHNSLGRLIRSESGSYAGLVPGMLAEKVIHIADDMTFTNEPAPGEAPSTHFLPCGGRMLAARFIEKYPFLWTKGIAADRAGKLTEVEQQNGKWPALQGSTVIGCYADLQHWVAEDICSELVLRLGLDSEGAEPGRVIQSFVVGHLRELMQLGKEG